jgi:hypothetical protein
MLSANFTPNPGFFRSLWRPVALALRENTGFFRGLLTRYP